MKLWDKGYTTDNLVEKFTVGNDRILDLKLAKYDVEVNLAHAKMLFEIGLLEENELENLIEGLLDIKSEIEAGTFIIEEEFEDVHSKIEFVLTKKYGEAGKKIHTARSRNDQVLTDLHLYAKNEIKKTKKLVKNLFETLISLSEKHKNDLMPGYTHTQIAMPSSFGLWFSAYAELLSDDLIFLNAAYKISDQNPLGSAAGFGSSFPINRKTTTELLGFSELKYNSIAAQASRGKLEKSVGLAISSIAGTLSKLSADICLFMSQNFDFISFPKKLTTGSSIMPHKQNPDVFELIRAKANKLQNFPNEISFITNNLTTGYHRDFQLLKEGFMTSIDEIQEILELSDFMLKHIEVKENLLEKSIYKLIFSVEELNKLVQEGMSFRDAYKEIGKQILNDDFEPEKKVSHSHIGSIGNLANEQIKVKFDSVFNSD